MSAAAHAHVPPAWQGFLVLLSRLALAECHQRIAEELGKTDDGRARVQRAIQRKVPARYKGPGDVLKVVPPAGQPRIPRTIPEEIEEQAKVEDTIGGEIYEES